jgi:hypothetical protein
LSAKDLANHTSAGLAEAWQVSTTGKNYVKAFA